MNSQQLLFINFIIFFGVVLFFILGRGKSKSPARLNMKPNVPEENPQIKTSEVALKVIEEPKNEAAERLEAEIVNKAKEVNYQAKSELITQPLKVISSKSVMIVYNGHEWDAFEVLGVSLEADIREITSKYQQLIKTSDPSSFEFLEAAYMAILQKRRS